MGGGRTGPQTSWLTPRCRGRDFPTCSPICRARNVLPAEATAVWLCGGCRCCLDSSTPLTFTRQIPTWCLCKVLRHWRKSDMAPLSSSPWSEKMPKGAVKQQRCWTRHVGETQRTATTNDHKPRGLQQKCILSVLKAGSLKSRCQQGWLCPEALREQLAHDWWLPSILGPLARSCIAPVSASIFTWPSALRLFPLLSSYKDLSLDLGPLLIKGGLKYRSLISSAKMLFPNKVTLSGSGWPLPLGGSQFNPGQHSYKGPGRTRLTSSRRLCEGGDTRWSLKEERLFVRWTWGRIWQTQGPQNSYGSVTPHATTETASSWAWLESGCEREGRSRRPEACRAPPVKGTTKP